jgi:hypothetical protein
MSHKRTVEKHILSVKSSFTTTQLTSTLLTGLYPGLMSNFRVCGTLLPTESNVSSVYCWLLLIHRHGQTLPSITFPSNSSDEVKNGYGDEEAVILFGYGSLFYKNTFPGKYNGRHYDVCSRTKRNLYREDALVMAYKDRGSSAAIYMAVQFFVEY